MSNTELRLMVVVFTRRMANGETFEEISADYLKLTTEDLAKIREALNR